MYMIMEIARFGNLYKVWVFDNLRRPLAILWIHYNSWFKEYRLDLIKCFVDEPMCRKVVDYAIKHSSFGQLLRKGDEVLARREYTFAQLPRKW